MIDYCFHMIIFSTIILIIKNFSFVSSILPNHSYNFTFNYPISNSTYNSYTIDIDYDEAELESINNNNKHFFMLTKKLSDGEIVTKVKFNNTYAIETKIGDLCLKQLSDETHLIQLWFLNEQLVDCEFITNKKSAKQFAKQFFQDNEIISYNEIFNDDNNLHCNQNSTCSRINLSKPNQTDQFDKIAKVKTLINYKLWYKKCHQLHQNFRKKYHITNNDYGKSKKLQRWKRADLLVFPGTNWCGKGSTSRNFEDLGRHVFADKCCRDHDGCKYTIGPFEKKYHLFNYRFHYVSHCECDERFRSCLKMSNTGAANLIGKIFFNVVQTKCFVFKSERVCIRRSWWGKCLKTRKKKRAVFRNGLRY